MLLALATPKLWDRFSLARASPLPLCEERRPAVGLCSDGRGSKRIPPALLPRGTASLDRIWQDCPPSSPQAPIYILPRKSGVQSLHGLRPLPSASPSSQPPRGHPDMVPS